MPKSPLRLARERRGLTINAVGQAVGIDPGNLSRIERGAQSPSLSSTEKLAAFFGNEVTEVEILYPQRYVAAATEGAPQDA